MLRNGIDLELIAAATAGVERDPYRIAYVSRPERGLEVLLNSVLPRLLAEEPRTHLSIATYAGGRPSLARYEAHLRSLAARYPEAVTWHEPLGNRDLYRLLGSAGLILYPTPVPTESGFAETSCIVAMEAMACGAAWISTDAGALPETVGAGGVLVPLGDGEHAAAPAVVDTMVAEALRVMREPDHAERLRVAGRSRAAGLGWAPVAEQLVELARGTIARPRSVPAPAVARTKGHIAIATPVYGQLMHSECTRSLLLTAARLRDDGYTMTWLTNSLASIQLARSHLTAMFLAIPEATHMMWVDADLSFPRDAISRLLAHDLPVVSGLYPFKRLPIEFPWTCATNEQGYTRRLASGVVEAAEVPGGFVLVKREVYLALMEAFPERWLPAAAQDDEHARLTPWCYDFYPHLLENGLVVPEDYAFCRLWRSLGGTIWADLSIRLTHHGWHGFTGDPMSLMAPAMPASEAA